MWKYSDFRTDDQALLDLKFAVALAIDQSQGSEYRKFLVLEKTFMFQLRSLPRVFWVSVIKH